MKFSLKTIAAAVALAAAATGANAAIDLATTGLPNSNVAVGGSELVFFAWDSVAGSSFTFDTGLTLESFRPATDANQSFSFASLSLASAAFGSFKASIGNDFTNTTWGVMALRNGSATGATGSVTLATTVRANDDLVAAGQKSSSLKTIDTFLNPTLIAANAAGHAAAANLTGDFAADGQDGFWGTSMQSNLGGKLAIEADNAVGTGRYTFFEVLAAKSGTLAPTVNAYDDVKAWSFDGATLTYAAAVPEPESYAMFLAGLGLMGAIARRRRAK